jgi:hypothetical protein
MSFFWSYFLASALCGGCAIGLFLCSVDAQTRHTQRFYEWTAFAAMLGAAFFMLLFCLNIRIW